MTKSVTTNDGKLYSIVIRFRQAFENVDFSDTGRLDQFPSDTCDLVSKVLAVALYTNGFSDVSVFHGTLTGDTTHHWVRIGDYTVDITADQFDGLDAVIVTDTLNWNVHANGTLYRKIDRDFVDNFWSHPWQEFARNVYNRVSTYIAKQHGDDEP